MWSVGLFLIIAACGTSSPSQNASSVPGASSLSQRPQATAVINEAPVAVITQSPSRAPTKTPSGRLDLDVRSSNVETAVEPVVSSSARVTLGTTSAVPAATVAATSLTIATPTDAANLPPVLVQPAPTHTPGHTQAFQQDTEAKLDTKESLEEVTPIPTAVPTAIEVTAAPADVPTSVAVEEAIDLKETSVADGGAHRFVLPSALGGQVSLDEYLEQGNVILVFYRAFW